MAIKKVTKQSIKALQEHKRLEEIENHNALVEAVNRLVNNKPKVVTKGTKLSVSTVAEEAGLSRGTVYRHQDIIKKLKSIKENPHKSDFQIKKAQEAKEAEKIKNLNSITDQLNYDKQKLAQELYKLGLENADLKSKVRNLERNLSKSRIRTI